MNTPTNIDDIIDSRDVIARIEELEAERDALIEAAQEAESEAAELEAEAAQGEEVPLSLADRAADARIAANLAADVCDQWDNSSEGADLAALKALAAEAEGYASDWHHGEVLIRNSYFKDYAMQLAEDIGALNAEASWPNTCIDWDQAARELQMDYSAVEFYGVTYWIR